MTISIRQFALILFAVMITPLAWGLDLAQWQYRTPLAFDSHDQPYARLTLTEQIYNASRDNLADLRLIDNQQKQIPYVLFQPHDQTKRTDYPLETLNRAAAEDHAAMITVDFGRQTIKTDLAVETTGDNFRRAVQIEGSNDNREFFVLVEKAYVFAVSAPGASHRYSTVQLPRNDFRYLRIRVAPMPGEEQSLTIQSVKASQTENTIVASKTVDFELTNSQSDPKQQTSSFDFDSQFNNLPLVSLGLTVTDESFYRRVAVEGREQIERTVEILGEDNRPRSHTVEVPWRHLTSGVIYRCKSRNGSTSESLSLSLPTAPLPRYLRITVSNYDDQPLTITALRARMIPHELVFPRPADEKCFLYAGNPTAATPQYDLAHTLPNPPATLAARASLTTPIENNPDFANTAYTPAVPWTEKHKLIFWAILGLTVLTLAAFIARSLKSLLTAAEPKNNPDE